jgi:hypothetical protein
MVLPLSLGLFHNPAPHGQLTRNPEGLKIQLKAREACCVKHGGRFSISQAGRVEGGLIVELFFYIDDGAKQEQAQAGDQEAPAGPA